MEIHATSRRRSRRDAPLLARHVSVAGGLAKAFDRAEDLGMTAMQIFVKNANRWSAPALTDEAAARFRARRRESPLRAVVAHASYLVNLASREEPTRSRSLDALTDELDRCLRLGIDGLVLHPGAHLGVGVDAGVERVAQSIDAVFDRLRGVPGETLLLLENTAGQGTYLGSELRELAAIRQRCRSPERVAYCLDTCHAFAAGSALHRADGVATWLQQIRDVLGLEHVRCLHLNDSRTGCGSHRDRHANIGRGEIGSRPFARIMRAPELFAVPKILETPSGENLAGHRDDLRRLRRQAARRIRAR